MGMNKKLATHGLSLVFGAFLYWYVSSYIEYARLLKEYNSHTDGLFARIPEDQKAYFRSDGSRVEL